MKFNVLQQDLWPSLSAVARSVGVRSQLPVLGNILLQTNAGQLQLSATNLEIGVVKNIKVEIEEEGEITIPAKTLVEMVSNLAGEKITFLSQGEILEITTPSFSAKLNGISAVEFPTIPLSGTKSITISPEEMLKSVPQVSFAAAVDDGRPILTGILTEFKDSQLQLVATDGYRLAHKIVPSKESTAFKVLVPRRTFEELSRLLAEEEVDDIKIATTDDQNQIIFQFGNTKMSSRLIEGQFPAWEKIIPTEMKARIVVDRAELLKAVKLASVFARSEANIIKMQNVLASLTGGPGKLILSSEAKELGSQKKEVEAEVEGEEINIAFNAKFLQDALSAINSLQVMIELSGGLSAAKIKPVGEEGLQYIIMPVNLS